MRVADQTLGLAIILGAGVMAYAALQLPGGAPGDFGPDLFPLIIAGGGALSGLALILRDRAARASSAPRPTLPKLRWAQGLSVVVALVFALIALPVLGFVLTILPVLILVLAAFGAGVLRAVLVAVLCTAAIKLVFTQVLAVPLPVAPFFPL